MQTTKDPLVGLLQHIDCKSDEARDEQRRHAAYGGDRYISACGKVSALADVRKSVCYWIGEAANAEKPSPVVGSSAWVGEHGQEPSGERRETGGPLVGRGVLKAIYEDDIAEMKERVQDALQTRLCRRTLAAVEWELKRMMDENESLAVAVAAEDNGESKSGACSPTDQDMP